MANEKRLIACLLTQPAWKEVRQVRQVNVFVTMVLKMRITGLKKTS
jgi:hypothetical protein